MVSIGMGAALVAGWRWLTSAVSAARSWRRLAVAYAGSLRHAARAACFGLIAVAGPFACSAPPDGDFLSSNPVAAGSTLAGSLGMTAGVQFPRSSGAIIVAANSSRPSLPAQAAEFTTQWHLAAALTAGREGSVLPPTRRGADRAGAPLKLSPDQSNWPAESARVDFGVVHAMSLAVDAAVPVVGSLPATPAAEAGRGLDRFGTPASPAPVIPVVVSGLSLAP